MNERKILIVEDEQIVAAELKEIVLSFGSYSVTTVASGREALAKTEALRPDLVLMDIRIKGDMDGIDTAASMMGQWDTPVIYVTAHADQETLRRAKLTSPLGYVLKPFSERELQIAIEMAIYKHEMERQMKQQRQTFSAMLESIGDAVIATDREGRVTLLNAAAMSLTGFTESEALGLDITMVLNMVGGSPSTVDEHREEACSAPPKTTESVRYTATIIARGGKEIAVNGTTNYIVDEKGERRGRIFAFREALEPGGQTESARPVRFALNQ